MRQKILNLDHRVTQSLQGRPLPLRFLMLAASFLGLPVIASVLVAGWVLAVFGFTSQAIIAGLFLCFVACGLTMLLKLVLRRQRPATIYAQNMRIKTYSFPSGHSFSAAILYGYTAHLIGLYAVNSWAAWAMISLYALIFLVGLSRVYLGAHYALDVLAGWFLGFLLLWAITVIIPL